ncbi:MAG: ABC transporter permease [Dehalococcoidales bacterium]|nr:ABC transporter permease [Dehalococcoidales bacterium]
MRFADVIKTAFYNLWRKKFRTFLTILAIVIGAVLIALMTSIGTGLQRFIVDQFGLMVPQDALTVYASNRSFSYTETPYEIVDTSDVVIRSFTADDVDKLLSIEGVERVDYNIGVSALYVRAEGNEKKYSISINSGPDYQIKMMTLVTGDFFEEDSSGECLISFDYLGAFGWEKAEDAVGKEITITVGKSNAYNTETKNYSFVISGVILKTMNATQIVISMNDTIEMARYYRNNPNQYSPEQPGTSLLVKVSDVNDVERVAEIIRAEGFSTITPNEILKEINSIFSIIQIGLSAFGIIALVVASIGIINTLMMSIYERTREIGVMKAVGATRGTIRMLFTMEGAALGFIGGIAGVAIGFVAGKILNIIGSYTFLSDYPTFEMSVFSIQLVLMVVAVTTAISLIAGLYPANRAAKLDAVEALRYE